RVAPRQNCLHSHYLVTPDPRSIHHHHDYFGNPISLFTILEPHRKLSITVKHRIDVTPGQPPNLAQTPTWEQVRDMLKVDRSAATLEACPFTFDSHFIQR